MHIIEPGRNSNIYNKKKAKIPFVVSLLVLSIIFLAFAASKFGIFTKESNNEDIGQSSNQVDISDSNYSDNSDDLENVNNVLHEFSGNEFRIFYDNLLLPNLLQVENPPIITGDDVADARIRKLAEDRGYRLRLSPSTSLSEVDGFKVQSPVVESWKKLKSEAKAQGLGLSIVSAYRSVDDQRTLFTQRLYSTGVTVEQIVNGKVDEKIDKTLVTTSIPGYSKHHTGYTLDLLCSGFAFENFKNSSCHDWLAANNYKVAKEAGFIPSYPDDADSQGPDPEAWEYVWVGSERLYE